MPFTANEEQYLSNDLCEFAPEPVDLKQENMRMFDQHQQNGLYNQSKYAPPANGFLNLWTSNDVAELPHLGSLAPEYIVGGNYNTDVSDDMQFGQAPVIFENGSVSTVSLPLFAPNLSDTAKSSQHEYAGGVRVELSHDRKLEVSPGAETGKKKPKAKKQYLSEQEAALMEKDDSELSEQELVIKKKAQNRLAQRAFRERKELKLKELENKLLESEEERQKLLEKLEEIKLQFISVRTENRFLRNSADRPAAGTNYPLSLEKSKFVFPKSQQEFIAEMVQGGHHEVSEETINKIYNEPQNPGRKVLAVGAVWDYLQIKAEEEEFENVDMMEVMTLLKGNELCHGYGPAYPLDLVEAALCQVLGQ